MCFNFRCFLTFNPLTVERNTLYRAGGFEHALDEYVGAIWINLRLDNINNADVTLRNNEAYDSTYSGFSIRGPYEITDLIVDQFMIQSPGTYGIQLRQLPTGYGTFSYVKVYKPGISGLDTGNSSFTINKGDGNEGW